MGYYAIKSNELLQQIDESHRLIRKWSWTQNTTFSTIPLIWSSRIDKIENFYYDYKVPSCKRQLPLRLTIRTSQISDIIIAFLNPPNNPSDSAYRCTHGYDLFQPKDTKQELLVHRWNQAESRNKLPGVLSQYGKHRLCYFPQQWVVAICIKCLPGKLITDSVSMVFIGAGHIDTLCLTCAKIPDTQKESRCLA